MRPLFAVLVLAACDPKADKDGDTDPGDTDQTTDTDTDTTDTDTVTPTDTDTVTDTDPGTDTDTDTDLPPSPEVCDDGIDNDQDGDRDCRDADCSATCDADGDGAIAQPLGGPDCDDADPEVHPGADEICDTIDNDCDARVDDNDPDLVPYGALVQYVDNDMDGYGGQPTFGCVLLAGNVDNQEDCDDSRATVNPAAAEVCNHVDDDCDTLRDEEDPDLDPAVLTTFWVDTDADGLGDPGSPVGACFQQDYADNGDDCDDRDPDFGLPVDWYADADADGHGAGGPVELALCAPVDPRHVMSSDDCDAGDPTIHPGAEEVCLDGIDQDCNGIDDCHIPLEGEARATDSEVLLYGAGGEAAGAAATIADADLDGHDELLVASSSGSAAANTRGVAYIWRGPWADGAYPLTDADVVISGETVTSRFQAFRVTPDITGDGLDDAVIGDPGYANSTGRGYVIPGPLTTGGEVALLARATLEGDPGTSTAAWLEPADRDGDGDTELWVTSSAVSGTLWVAEGPFGGSIPLSTGDGFHGVQNDALNTRSLGSDDFDGDGLAEMAVGAWLAGGTRGAVVVFDHDPVGLEDITMADVRIDGPAVGSNFGTVCRPVGDLTGDGYPDLLTSAPNANGGDGAAYVYAGPLSAGPAEIEVRGFNQFGTNGGPVGDVDGDGRPEVVIGTGAGTASDQYILDLEGLSGVLTDAAVTDFILRDSASESLGEASISGGDLDEDGFSDIALGGVGIDSPLGPDAGGVRLLFGFPPLNP